MDIPNVLELRMRIGDPTGYPVIVEADELPSEPDEQTAYRLADGRYLDSDGNRIMVMLGDARIDAWITELGTEQAECRCYTSLAAQLGAQTRVVRLQSGAESTEYTKMLELYEFYRQLSDECKDRYRASQGNNSGRIGQTVQPVIGGGYL